MFLVCLSYLNLACEFGLRVQVSANDCFGEKTLLRPCVSPPARGIIIFKECRSKKVCHRKDGEASG